MGIEGTTWGLGTREGEGFSIYFIHILIFKASLYRVARGGVRDTCASGPPHEGVAHTKGGGAPLAWVHTDHSASLVSALCPV